MLFILNIPNDFINTFGNRVVIDCCCLWTTKSKRKLLNKRYDTFQHFEFFANYRIREWVDGYAFLFKKVSKTQNRNEKDHYFSFTNSSCMHYSNCSQNNLMRRMLSLTFYWWNWASERLNYFHRLTQLVNDRPRPTHRILDSKFSWTFTILPCY